MTIKKCTVCKNEKPIQDFRKWCRSVDGHAGICKPCYKVKSKIYYENNKEEICRRKREYESQNKEKRAKLSRDYYVKHKDRLIELTKARRQENKEHYKAYQEEYAIKNKEKITEYKKKYEEDNKEKRYLQKKEYRKTERFKISRRNSENKRRQIYKDGNLSTDQLEHLYQTTTKCYWCNEKLIKGNVHLDHYMPLSKGGTHTIDNIVLTCSSCNFKKNAKDPLQYANELGRLL